MTKEYSKNPSLFEEKNYTLSYSVSIDELGASDDYISKHKLEEYILNYIKNYAILVGEGSYEDFVKWVREDKSTEKILVKFTVSKYESKSHKKRTKKETVVEEV